MKKFIFILILFTLSLLPGQSSETNNKEAKEIGAIPGLVVSKVTDALVAKYGEAVRERALKGVEQAARLWQTPDGSPSDFENLCLVHFSASDQDRESLFNIISKNYEVLRGLFNKITLALREPLDMDTGTIHPVESLFGAYNVNSHLEEDLFQNKIAFITVLNLNFCLSPFLQLRETK